MRRTRPLCRPRSLALMAHGYRPDTARPGHHQTVVQALALTIGLAASRVTVLDTLRRKRNISDYTGEDIDDSSVDHCRKEAKQLLSDVVGGSRTTAPI